MTRPTPTTHPPGPAAMAPRRPPAGGRAGRARRRAGVLVAVLASYIGGAAIASALGSSPVLLFIPPAVLAVFAVYVHFDTHIQMAFAQSRARLRTRAPIDV